MHESYGFERWVKGVFRLRLMLMLVFCACGGMANAQKGIVVWKEQKYHKDESARAFVFDQMQVFPEIIWFSKGAERMGFQKHEFHEYVLFPPPLPAELAEPEQFASYRLQFTELGSFARRFPAVVGILKPQLERMREALAKYEAGQVYFSGEWMPRTDYEVKLAKRDSLLRQQAAERQAERAKRAGRLEAERHAALRKSMEMERQEGCRYLYGYGFGITLYLILMVTAMVRDMRLLRNGLALALLLAMGWMTYDHGSLGWIEEHAQKIPQAWKFSEQDP
jgi:hypothetical protein